MGVAVRFTKWGGKRHWEYELEPLGSDRYGWWLGGRTGMSLRRGSEAPVLQPHDFVALVPADGWWIANWNASGETPVEIYVDVTDRPVWTGESVSAVDLDLDVVRLRDGTVELLDEDEFAEHQIRYGYPAEVIERARATADELMARVGARDEPFGQVGAAWLARFAGAVRNSGRIRAGNA